MENRIYKICVDGAVEITLPYLGISTYSKNNKRDIEIAVAEAMKCTLIMTLFYEKGKWN